MKRKEKKDSAGSRTVKQARKEWCSNSKLQPRRSLVSSSYSGFINIAVGLHSAGQKIRHAEKRNFLMDARRARRGRDGENICFELLFHSCADFSIWMTGNNKAFFLGVSLLTWSRGCALGCVSSTSRSRENVPKGPSDISDRSGT